MAHYVEYVCTGCGYEVSCPPSGKDALMAGEVTTYVCDTCKEVFNLLDREIKEHGPVCPDCGGHLTPWKPKDNCPKCGAKLKKSGLQMMVD